GLRDFLLLDLLLQGDERTVLERLDRPLGFVEDRRHLRVRKVEDELQRQYLLLLGREALDELQHRLPANRLHRRELGGRLLLARRLGDRFLRLPAAAGADVGRREVGGRRERGG